MRSEITAAEITAIFDRVFSRQRSRLFMVIAFYLDPGLIPVIRPHLDEDIPPVGAVGRYRTVPVFPTVPERDTDLPRRTEEFVEYAYAELLSAT